MLLASQHQTGLSGSASLLAEIAEEITRRLEAGEPLSEEGLAKDWPELATMVGRLLPALRSLAELAAAPEAGGNRDALGPAAPRTLGDFRILQEIGRGGMGIVFEAEQLSLGRRVALKVLPRAALLDERALQRFRLESQAAALLAHPSIVPVYTVGESDGLPYYAMQFIEGRNLAEILVELTRACGGPEPAGAEHAAADEPARELADRLIRGRLEQDGDPGLLALRGSDSHEGGSGSTVQTEPPGRSGVGGRVHSRSYVRAIARLAVRSAEALQYAHELGVIHRDVKPANLILDCHGKLWLTDFGLARLSTEEGLTRTGDLPGTLRYMSPEQTQRGAGPVDPRADIYALGATLYELLTLQPAITGRDRIELLRNIADQVPRPIRQLNPAVPRDLATIVARCLAKEPAGRYATAKDLAEDLTRFLEARPILADPVGPLERGVRWCRRKPALAASIVSLVLSLLGGMVGISLSWREALHQRDLLDQARRTVAVERDQKEQQRQMAETARGRAEAAERQARESAAIAAAVKNFLNQKILLEAVPDHSPIERKLTLLEVVKRASRDVGSSFARQPMVEAEIRSLLGSTLHKLGEYAEAADHARRAHELLLKHRGADAKETGHEAVTLADLLLHLGRHDQSEALLRQAQARLASSPNPDQRLLARVETALGDLEVDRERFAEAEAIFRRRLEAGHDANPDAACGLRYRLAYCLQRLGRLDEAEPLYRESVQIGRKALGEKDNTTLAAVNNLGTFLEQRGRLAEAEELFRKNLAATAEVRGPSHPSTLAAAANLAFVLLRSQRFTEAERILTESISTASSTLGPDHPSIDNLEYELGMVLARSGQIPRAHQLATHALTRQTKARGPDHPSTRRWQAALQQLDGRR